MATLYKPTPENIAFLAEKLREGELVAIPTETVYGLAANAFDPSACRKVFEAKGRPQSDPLIVHIGASFDIERIAYPNELLKRLEKRFWPGPLTLILRKKKPLPDVVTSGLDSVAVRMPAHPLLQQLLARVDFPIAAPSANPFAYVSPTTAQHVAESLGERIAYILDGGPCTIGIESTILDIRNADSPRLLRPGKIGHEQLSEILERPVSTPHHNTSPPVAPGQMKKHYSPKTRVELCDSLPNGAEARPPPGTGYLYFRKPAAHGAGVFWLTDDGSLEEAAQNLFLRLREIDGKCFETILVERAPDNGIGRAINDRLRRAAEE